MQTYFPLFGGRRPLIDYLCLCCTYNLEAFSSYPWLTIWHMRAGVTLISPCAPWFLTVASAALWDGQQRPQTKDTFTYNYLATKRAGSVSALSPIWLMTTGAMNHKIVCHNLFHPWPPNMIHSWISQKSRSLRLFRYFFLLNNIDNKEMATIWVWIFWDKFSIEKKFCRIVVFFFWNIKLFF